MQAGLSQSPSELRSAFETFNHLSVQLTQSYEVLEKQVSELTKELDVVSEQRLQELTEKEKVANRLETLINLLPGGVIVLDCNGIVIDSNPVAETLLEPNLKGQYWRDIIERCFAPRDDDGHEVSNLQGRRINITTRSLEEDGQIILLTDQTETRQLQKELSRHERLTALGKMVSTLAHQVRTPLSSAMLYGGHLLDSNLPQEKQQQFTQKLVNRLHEMERQVNDMLLFVKSDITLEDVLTLTDLKELLYESMEMPLQQSDATVCWEINCHENNIEIICNKTALISAILNLINNSLQSGKDSMRLFLRLAVDKENLILVIEDNGTGIPPNQLEKVNELFFTTKPQGTGIGLSVVNAVVKAHKGDFTLQGKEINGTRYGVIATMKLPIIKKP